MSLKRIRLILKEFVKIEEEKQKQIEKTNEDTDI